MNRKELNNEIILCRPAVRKARVAVIRKTLKKMKILKSCKIESIKEKKLKKAERLFKQIQIMKKAKDDEVTKFALRNINIENYLKGPAADLKQRAFASLAIHDAVMKKIISIRERIPNWETEIPLLLDSLGKKKKSSVIKKSNKSEKQGLEKTKSDLLKDLVEPKVKIKVEGNCAKDGSKKTFKKEKAIKTQVKVKSIEEENIEVNENYISLRDISPQNDKIKKLEDKHNDSSLIRHTSKENEKIEKIDDPFFIEKKVIAPKLLIEDTTNKKSTSKIEKIKRDNVTSIFNPKPFRVKKEPKLNFHKTESEPSEEKLHPSWAAKKIKLIKPFEGKKIKFSDD